MTIFIIAAIGLLIFFGFVVTLVLLSEELTPEEQHREDEEQLAAIRKWNKQRSKKMTQCKECEYYTDGAGYRYCDLTGLTMDKDDGCTIPDKDGEKE